MKTTNNHINFKANLINKTNVGKIVNGCYPGYEQKAVSFIKIDPINSVDIKALEETANYWIYGGFATNIYNAACELRNNNKAFIGNEIFALTKQETNFEKLNSDDLLGLINVSPAEDDFTFIDYLQVNPEYVLYYTMPEYKGIGTGILNSLKLLHNKLCCDPSVSDYVVRFYKKNGFVKNPDKPKYYTYCG